MVRIRERKTNRGLHSEASMGETVELVEGGISLRAASELNNVKCTVLHRYVQKRKATGNGVAIPMIPIQYAVNKIFSNELEKALEQYLMTCSKICYGLDTLETRHLAYEMAKFHNLNIPQSWEEREMAGIDRLYGFRKVDMFYFPLEPDMAMVSILDIELVLPKPSIAGKIAKIK